MTDDTDTETDTETESTDANTDDPDTSEWVAENSDTTQPPGALEERDRREDAEWHCASCGAPVADAHALANHECDED